MEQVNLKLREYEIFKDISEESIRKLKSDCRLTKYDCRQVISDQGEISNVVNIILSGEARLIGGIGKEMLLTKN